MSYYFSGDSAGSVMAIISVSIVIVFPITMSTIFLMKGKENNLFKFNALTNGLKNNCQFWKILELYKLLLALMILCFLCDYSCL